MWLARQDDDESPAEYVGVPVVVALPCWWQCAALRFGVAASGRDDIMEEASREESVERLLVGCAQLMRFG